MEPITIKCRCVYKGHKAGVALVSTEGIGCWGSIEESSGIVTERGHALQGECIKDRVLVFPYAKGSCGWAKSFQNMAHYEVNPIAMICPNVESRLALGAVTSKTTTVSDLDQDPFSLIETGDWVEVDADQGKITVTKKEK